MQINRLKPNETPEWIELLEHFNNIKNLDIRDFFNEDPNRVNEFTIETANLFVDFSKNRITQRTIQLLLNLAERMNLQHEIRRMFTGELINETEHRAVLHTALRNSSNQPVEAGGKDVMPEVNKVIDQMERLSEKIVSGEWTGFSGKRIKNIVNIGIGGSDLGPSMAYEALKFYSNRAITVRFISNIDSAHLVEQLQGLKPEETLFIISSKTFTTQETMTNAQSAKRWVLEAFKDDTAIQKHFIAVSTNREMVKQFGIDTSNMLVFWDWVGGRFSLTSAIGFSLMIALGNENFRRLRAGFHEMDTHFRSTPLPENLPVLMGLISVWYNNFFGAQTQAILPYSQYLHQFPAYLQQCDMESNGKSTDRAGNPISYQSAPVIWGASGTNGQHAFYQLLHQGTKLVPCDFIGFINPLNDIGDHHHKLMANFFAQQKALAFGKKDGDLEKEKIPQRLIPYKRFEGNKPSTCIMANKLTPESLGSLIAMYEHKIFVQGVIWNIFSFDQWGVELGKQLAGDILQEISDKKINRQSHDESTRHQIKYYLQHQLKD